MIESMAFLYTNKCNAKCPMCVVDAGPHREEKMSLAEAKAYLNLTREVPSLKKMILTGGESLLFFDEILKILACARSLGLETKVITNAYWAESQEAALTKLRILKASGLGFLTLSTDHYHREFIPIANIRHALDAAHELKVPCSVALVIGKKERQNIRKHIGALGNDRKFYYINGLGFEKYSYRQAPKTLTGLELLPLQPFGRGWQEKKESILRFPKELGAGNCPLIGRTISVVPGGNVFWCCSHYDRDRKIHDDFRIGNLRLDSLKSLNHDLAYNALCEYLAYQGPVSLLKEAIRSAGTKPTRKKFTCLCDICHEAFRMVGKNHLYALALRQTILTKVLRVAMLKSAGKIASTIKKSLPH